MRRSRLGGHAGHEFPSSGEDSFVAVVVTKLTGALLFLLLLVMVIMALVPKAIDLPSPTDEVAEELQDPLEITTPDTLPEAIAGRPYSVALAAAGSRGSLRWAIDGELPEGLDFDPERGLIEGIPRAGTPEPVELLLRVSDGHDRAARLSRLVVYRPDAPLSTPSKWAPTLPPIPWNSWLEQGFGFLLLLLVHMVGIQALGSIERRSEASNRSRRLRFIAYRWTMRLATLSALVGLAAWLWSQGRS